MLGLRLIAEICSRTHSRHKTASICAELRAISSLTPYRPQETQAVSTVSKRGLDVLHDPLVNKVRRWCMQSMPCGHSCSPV